MTVRQNRRFQGDSEPSFRLEIHGSAGCSLGRYTRPQHQKSKIQVASFSVFDFLAKPGRESPQRQAPKNVLLAKKCGDFVFLGGLVGAETCCQTVQKVGEVRLESFWPEIVEAVGRGQVTVRRKRRFQGDSEPSFRLEIHGSAGCSLSDSPAEPSISR